MKNVAVILSGCGHLDGAEIRESVLALLALESEGVQYKIFAPNKEQHHVVSHMKGEEVENAEKRNVLEESARIARGEIEDVTHLQVEDFDAILFPGGFGVAKNLCSFAFKGSDACADELITSKIVAFKLANKPIGAICISPALVALAIGEFTPTMTIGTDQCVAIELEKLGVKHQTCVVSDCIIDEDNKIITTPAYMDDSATLPDVFTGITKLVKNLIAII